MKENRNQSTPLSSSERRARNAFLVSATTSVIMFAATIYLLVNKVSLWQAAPLLGISLIAAWLSRNKRHTLAGWLLIGAASIQSIVSPIAQSGLGWSGALGAFAIIGGISLAVFPRKVFGQVFMFSIFVAGATVAVDFISPADRPQVPQPVGNWVFTLILVAVYAFFFLREYKFFPLRVKLILGILLTGSISLGVLVSFTYNRATLIVDLLTGQLENSVRQRSEKQLTSLAQSNAASLNNLFQDIGDDIKGLAAYRSSLVDQYETLSRGEYWDAHTRVFQLPGGQYGNSRTDLASVFIPSTVTLDEGMLSELNLTAYLNFVAPHFLEIHPSLTAIYYIDRNNTTTYYPNINLAEQVPPDFDATAQEFYQIVTPAHDPGKDLRWTPIYQDPAGTGLIATIAAPVYIGKDFRGVLAADLRIETIASQVNDIKIGKTGYAFLIDDKGRIIAMPPAGYTLFGMQPETVPLNETPKQTVREKGPVELQKVTTLMSAGGSGLLQENINGVDTYFVIAPLQATNYSLAVIVPVSEMNEAVITARRNVQQETIATFRLGSLIFLLLLGLAILVSLGGTRSIAMPITHLIETAEQVTAGNLNVEAQVETDDEIGRLANAFNIMTERLRNTLGDLEQRVKERTKELDSANKKNERRADQFQTVTRVAQAISATRNLNELLPEITRLISEMFNFYHVAIFLVDTMREYATLSASNSAGGKRMLERGHRLKVGATGIVGYVAGTGKPRIALDTGADANFLSNPDLPETHSEIALPLLSGTQVIGVLDVQSSESNAFGQEDIETLSALANQVTVALVNARLYEETRRALQEAEGFSQQFTREGWRKYLSAHNITGIRYSGMQSAILRERMEIPEMEEVLRTGKVTQITPRNKSDISLLLAPIKLHGEIIGILQVRGAGGRQWSDEEIDIVSSIMERAALALENARLLLESQKRAAKERVIGEMTSQIGSYTDKQNILRAAVTEIGRILPGADVLIQFQQKSNGSDDRNE